MPGLGMHARDATEPPARTVAERVDTLDVSLFDAIDSQTHASERRSLLALQRATARRHPRYAYLEIGSHLGGSLQPHVLDRRCARIFSIDPRPAQQPDDRAPGCRIDYVDNSTQRMLGLLGALAPEGVAKVQCFETDSARMDPAGIGAAPQLAFIDGEHTRGAALADFRFCSSVIAKDGVIAFHDFDYIHPAILEICAALRRTHPQCLALKLDGTLFALFYDPALVRSDAYLGELYARNRTYLRRFRIKAWARRLLPRPVRGALAFLVRPFAK